MVDNDTRPRAIKVDKDAFPFHVVYNSVVHPNTLGGCVGNEHPDAPPGPHQPREFYNGRGVFGETVLHWAAILDQPRTIQRLIEYGADIALTDELGRTAADYARAMHHHSALTLLEAAALNRGTAPRHRAR